jgi:hypothetical protein
MCGHALNTPSKSLSLIDMLGNVMDFKSAKRSWARTFLTNVVDLKLPCLPISSVCQNTGESTAALKPFDSSVSPALSRVCRYSVMQQRTSVGISEPFGEVRGALWAVFVARAHASFKRISSAAREIVSIVLMVALSSVRVCRGGGEKVE